MSGREAPHAAREEAERTSAAALKGNEGTCEYC
jgi:hypothetical protein